MAKPKMLPSRIVVSSQVLRLKAASSGQGYRDQDRERRAEASSISVGQSFSKHQRRDRRLLDQAHTEITAGRS